MLTVERRFMPRDEYRHGISISELAHPNSHNRKTVRRMVNEPPTPAPVTRRSKVRK